MGSCPKHIPEFSFFASFSFLFFGWAYICLEFQKVTPIASSIPWLADQCAVAAEQQW